MYTDPKKHLISEQSKQESVLHFAEYIIHVQFNTIQLLFFSPVFL